MKILPLTYLGNVSYFSHLAGGDCVIDLGENYVKQTHRNRCDILTANGTSALTVQVVKGGSSTKRPVRDMRIDYSKRWQHQHSSALVSAYRNAPYFEHYWERLAPFFERRFEYLADLNLELLDMMLRLTGIKNPPLFSDKYIVACETDTDLRGFFPPKNIVKTQGAEKKYPAEQTAGPVLLTMENQTPYWQVFSDRFDFIPNLSIIDLLLCEGPSPIDILLSRSST